MWPGGEHRRSQGLCLQISLKIHQTSGRLVSHVPAGPAAYNRVMKHRQCTAACPAQQLKLAQPAHKHFWWCMMAAGHTSKQGARSGSSAGDGSMASCRALARYVSCVMCFEALHHVNKLNCSNSSSACCKSFNLASCCTFEMHWYQWYVCDTVIHIHVTRRRAVR